MSASKYEQGVGFDRSPTPDQIAEARVQLDTLFLNFEGLVQEFSSAFELKNIGQTFATDDLALKPYLLTTEVQFALSSCIDHLQTLRNLTVCDLIPNLAAYTLVRSAIEHASLAMWYLDPEDPDERRRRVLVQSATGATLLAKALEDIGVSGTPSLETKLGKISEKAVSLGLEPVSQAEIKRSSIKDRVRWSGVVLQGLGVGSEGSNLISTVWQSASGIAHANSSAGLMLLNRRALVDHEETKSTTFHISTSEVEVARLFQLSIYLLETVLHLVKFREGLEADKYPSFSKGP